MFYAQVHQYETIYHSDSKGLAKYYHWTKSGLQIPCFLEQNNITYNYSVIYYCLSQQNRLICWSLWNTDSKRERRQWNSVIARKGASHIKDGKTLIKMLKSTKSAMIKLLIESCSVGRNKSRDNAAVQQFVSLDEKNSLCEAPTMW